MKIEQHQWFSPSLHQEMTLKVYGHQGKVMLVFPSSGGKYYEYEDFGMVAACSDFINTGRLQLITVDSVDNQSWFNKEIDPGIRTHRHDQYEQYILNEVIPFAHHHCQRPDPLMVTGCSMGGYHSANIFFRHPRFFDTVISLSGLYGPHYVLGNVMDDHLYFYFPLCYLPNLTDDALLTSYRQSRIILCVGQGPWEQCDEYDCIGETRSLKKILMQKQVPCWADFWGDDVSHDWFWWKKQMPYFLGRLDI